MRREPYCIKCTAWVRIAVTAVRPIGNDESVIRGQSRMTLVSCMD